MLGPAATTLPAHAALRGRLMLQAAGRRWLREGLDVDSPAGPCTPGRWSVRGLRRIQGCIGPALAPAQLLSIDALRRAGPSELRQLGRVLQPLVWRTGQRGFEVTSWSAVPTLPDARVLPGVGWSVDAHDTLPREADPLEPVLGVRGATCPLDAVLDAQVVVVWGADLERGQPTGLAWLQRARARGARVVWVADDPGQGVVVTDRAHRSRDPGQTADRALRALIQSGRVDHDFVDAFTNGVGHLTGPAGDLALADDVAGKRVVSLTAPRWAASVARLHLSQGALGKPGCGVIVWPGPGLTPRERSALEACHAGELAAWVSGADLRARAPHPQIVDEALQRPDVRVHLTTHVAPEHLIPAQHAVFLLPVASVHESGGHVRGVDGRVVHQPPVVDALPGDARSVSDALTALGWSASAPGRPQAAALRCVDGAMPTPDGLGRF